MDLDAMWAEVEAEAAAATTAPPAAPARPTYGQFDQLLGKPSKAPGGKTSKPPTSPAFSSRGSGSLAAVGQLKEALPPRPAAPTPASKAEGQPPAAASGRIQLDLRKAAAPVKLAAKPQASLAAREAAQRPAPPPPAPKPVLASKPAWPAAPEPPAAPQPPAEVAQPPAAPKPSAAPKARAQAKAVEQAVPPVAAKPEVRTPKPAAAQVTEAAPAVPEAPADATGEASAVAVRAPRPASKKQTAPVQPAQPTKAAAVEPKVVPAAAAAVQEAPTRPQRPQPPAPQQAGAQRSQEQRRAANAAYGAEALLDRRVEELTVWQVNAAGVLVRNDRLSGFVPTSLLAPATVSKVLEEEQRLAGTAATGFNAAQPQEGMQGGAGDVTELDAATRSALRREALATVLMGSKLSACVVNVDDSSGRVVLSERAAVSAWKQPGARAAAPTLEELRAAAKQLGDIVDATVVVVKPFGCFVEFSVALPGSDAESAASQQQAGPRSATLVGLVHASEVSWDPRVDVMQAVKAGQQVRAKVMHVDAAKARVFLSMRRTAPNPLLETLDSLVTSAAAASQAAPGSGGAGAADAGAAVAQLDQRPVLGDLSEAVAFAGLLRATRGVHSVELGVRLQSRAASQSLEVYIARNSAAGIGGAVAAVGGAASGSAAAQPAEAAAGLPADACSYNLVLRKETSVQEVAVVASLSRDEVRQLAASCVAELATAAEAAQVAAA